MRRGLDYSGTPPSAAAMRAAGFDFVIRYVVPGRTVSITAAEYRTLRAVGFDVAGVWERAADRSLAGRTAGAHDAAEALAYILSIGGPAGAVPYMVVDDWGAVATDMPAIADYMRGVADTVGPGRRAAYGGLRTIRYLFDHGLIDYGWQTYAWSGAAQARPGDILDDTTAWDPRAQLRQKPNGQTLNGVEVDHNTATTADFGQWPGGDMALDGTDVNLIWDDQTPWPGYATDLPHAAAAYSNREYLLAARVSAGRAARDAADAVTKADALAAQVAALATVVAQQGAMLAAKIDALTPASTADLNVTGTLHLGAP